MDDIEAFMLDVIRRADRECAECTRQRAASCECSFVAARLPAGYEAPAEAGSASSKATAGDGFAWRFDCRALVTNPSAVSGGQIWGTKDTNRLPLEVCCTRRVPNLATHRPT